MTLTRRDLLRSTALLGAGTGLGGFASLARAFPGHAAGAGYGPLVADPAGRLDLPAGFTYSLIAVAGVSYAITGPFQSAAT